MQNVLLIIHLLLALCLIGVVLLQRSEGGGLGMGSSGVMTGRGAATALTKLTWLFAAAFIGTSITLTILSARESAGTSVMDRAGTTPPAPAAPALPGLPSGGALLPPPAGDNPDAAAPAPAATPTTPTAPETATGASPAAPAAPAVPTVPVAPATPPRAQ